MYEHRTEHLLSRAKYLRRLSHHAAASVGLIAGSLSIGILGYHFLEHFSWIDALRSTLRGRRPEAFVRPGSEVPVRYAGARWRVRAA